MKIGIGDWSNTTNFFFTDKRGEGRILSHCAKALQLDGHEIIPINNTDCNNIDCIIYWGNFNEKTIDFLQSKYAKFVLVYSDNISVSNPLIPIANSKNIYFGIGQNTALHHHLSLHRKSILKEWQTIIQRKNGYYVPFPHTVSIVQSSNYYQTSIVFPTRWIYKLGEPEFVKVSNALVEAVLDINKSYQFIFLCDDLSHNTSKIILDLKSKYDLVSNICSTYNVALDLLSRSKMSLGVSSHGGSQYEAVSLGCLPMVWLDSIFFPTLCAHSEKLNIPRLRQECRTSSIKDIKDCVHVLLTNKQVYETLLNEYKMVLSEYTYASFLKHFYNAYKEIEELK